MLKGTFNGLMNTNPKKNIPDIVGCLVNYIAFEKASFGVAGNKTCYLSGLSNATTAG
jgi:hypothetical protein